MDKIKSITFDIEAQNALPKHIKDKMRKDLKEAEAKQCDIPVVTCSAEEAITLLKYYEEKCFKTINEKLVLVSDKHLQKYNTYKNWLDNKELHYR